MNRILYLIISLAFGIALFFIGAVVIGILAIFVLIMLIRSWLFKKDFDLKGFVKKTQSQTQDSIVRFRNSRFNKTWKKEEAKDVTDIEFKEKD
ncbi:hypothetical protein [Basilea psittacipulmonis]|uniref:hypothetical protein n=1 Tax=Basilea psittacipulmonis TaxID=1472345 RepID=UPI001177A835|nr:hypothetical protein [Basilea psittacipulmonis]